MIDAECFHISDIFYCLPDVGHISWDVELCTRVEVFLSAWYRWTQSLVLHSVSIKYTNSALVKLFILHSFDVNITD